MTAGAPEGPKPSLPQEVNSNTSSVHAVSKQLENLGSTQGWDKAWSVNDENSQEQTVQQKKRPGLGDAARWFTEKWRGGAEHFVQARDTAGEIKDTVLNTVPGGKWAQEKLEENRVNAQVHNPTGIELGKAQQHASEAENITKKNNPLRGEARLQHRRQSELRVAEKMIPVTYVDEENKPIDVSSLNQQTKDALGDMQVAFLEQMTQEIVPTRLPWWNVWQDPQVAANNERGREVARRSPQMVVRKVGEEFEVHFVQQNDGKGAQYNPETRTASFFKNGESSQNSGEPETAHLSVAVLRYKPSDKSHSDVLSPVDSDSKIDYIGDAVKDTHGRSGQERFHRKLINSLGQAIKDNRTHLLGVRLYVGARSSKSDLGGQPVDVVYAVQSDRNDILNRNAESLSFDATQRYRDLADLHKEGPIVVYADGQSREQLVSERINIDGVGKEQILNLSLGDATSVKQEREMLRVTQRLLARGENPSNLPGDMKNNRAVIAFQTLGGGDLLQLSSDIQQLDYEVERAIGISKKAGERRSDIEIAREVYKKSELFSGKTFTNEQQANFDRLLAAKYQPEQLNMVAAANATLEPGESLEHLRERVMRPFRDANVPEDVARKIADVVEARQVAIGDRLMAETFRVYSDAKMTPREEVIQYERLMTLVGENSSAKGMVEMARKAWEASQPKKVELQASTSQEADATVENLSTAEQRRLLQALLHASGQEVIPQRVTLATSTRTNR